MLPLAARGILPLSFLLATRHETYFGRAFIIPASLQIMHKIVQIRP